MFLKCFGIFKSKNSFRTSGKGTDIGSFVPTVMLIAFLDSFEALMKKLAFIFRALENFVLAESLEFL